MENNNAITPRVVRDVSQMRPEEIADVSDKVMEATQLGNQTVDELDNLDRCLGEFSVTQERYQKASKRVRDKMRYLVNHL